MPMQTIFPGNVRHSHYRTVSQQLWHLATPQSRYNGKTTTEEVHTMLHSFISLGASDANFLVPHSPHRCERLSQNMPFLDFVVL